MVTQTGPGLKIKINPTVQFNNMKQLSLIREHVIKAWMKRSLVSKLKCIMMNLEVNFVFEA